MRATQCPDCDLAFDTVSAWQFHKVQAHKGPRPERSHEREELRALQVQQRFHRYQSALKELRAFIERFTPTTNARTPLITDADRSEMTRLSEECHVSLEAWWDALHQDSRCEAPVSDPVLRRERRPRP
jgi:hypothetical protein